MGTTDLDHQTDLTTEASITADELEYLLAAVNHQFPYAAISEEDIVSTWSGVRPVVQEELSSAIDQKPSDANREHAIWEDQGVFTIAGGKLTTFRLLAREVLDKIYGPDLSIRSQVIHSQYDFSDDRLSNQQAQRLSGSYGVLAQSVMDGTDPELPAERVRDLNVLWAELIWSCRFESVQHLDDLMLRRTRLGQLLPNGGAALWPRIRTLCSQYLNWDEARWTEELARYQDIIKRHYSLPESGQ